MSYLKLKFKSRIINIMKIIIYTTSWCPSCIYAKRFFDEKNIIFQEIDIEKIDMSRDQLREITGGLTVPQIVIDGKSIGGYDRLIELYSLGKISFN